MRRITPKAGDPFQGRLYRSKKEESNCINFRVSIYHLVYKYPLIISARKKSRETKIEIHNGIEIHMGEKALEALREKNHVEFRSGIASFCGDLFLF